MLDLAAAGCPMTDINLTDYPYLQKLVTNDNVQSISLTNLPGLQTLVMGKNVNFLALGIRIISPILRLAARMRHLSRMPMVSSWNVITAGEPSV